MSISKRSKTRSRRQRTSLVALTKGETNITDTKCDILSYPLER